MVRRGDHHRVNVRAGNEFAEILERRAALEGPPVSLLLVISFNPFAAILTPVGIYVANRHDLHLLSPQESPHQSPPCTPSPMQPRRIRSLGAVCAKPLERTHGADDKTAACTRKRRRDIKDGDVMDRSIAEP